MKRFLRITLGVVLVLLLTMAVAMAAEGDKKSGSFSYRLKGNGTAVITGYEGTSEEVFVPRMVDGYTVTEIGENAFSAVESGYGKIITLPDTITVIGDKAFEECKASVINIPDSVQSIGDFAFQSCSNIQTVSIPASVERIGTGAFARCPSIKEFYVDSQNAVYATIDGVLYNKQKKELVVFPQGGYFWGGPSIPSGIESIASYAFVGMEYYFFNLPDTIKTIGDYAFADITFTNPERSSEKFSYPETGIQMPDALEHIGNHAFEEAKFDLVKFGSNLKTIGDYAFSYATIFTDSKYSDYSGYLRDLRLPDSIQTIGEAAFQGLTGLNNIDLSKTQIRIIEPRTFMNVRFNEYDSLEGDYILLPSSIQEIKEEAFSKAVLKNIKMENAELESIGKRAFAEAELDDIDFVGVKIKEIKEEAFSKAETRNINIDSVEIIGERAFANADLNHITIGSVETIGEQAFVNADAFHMNIGSVETIDKEAFANAFVVTISVGDNVKEIGDQAFYNCNFGGQKVFTLSSTVTTIGSEVFKDASGLETITIPASVERIGEDLCNKANVVLEVEKGSYAEMYALENGYQIKREENADTSWLNN